jgi:hypothetical protein
MFDTRTKLEIEESLLDCIAVLDDVIKNLPYYMKNIEGEKINAVSFKLKTALESVRYSVKDNE